MRTSKIGASITIDFNGSGFEFYGKKGSGAGDLEISVDGGEAKVVSEYVSGNAEFEVLLYKIDLGNVNEDHKIVITTKQGTVSNPNFNFDYFKIIREKEITPPVTVEKVAEKVEMEDTSNKYMKLNPAELVVSPGDTTYYLDSTAKDGGDGKTEAAAFESLEDINNIQFAPGDKILIKRGSTFIGQLYPKGSGSAEKPIVIDVYGEGDKPLINGNGLYSAAPSYVRISSLQTTYSALPIRKWQTRAAHTTQSVHLQLSKTIFSQDIIRQASLRTQETIQANNS